MPLPAATNFHRMWFSHWFARKAISSWILQATASPNSFPKNQQNFFPILTMFKFVLRLHLREASRVWYFTRMEKMNARREFTGNSTS